MVKSIWHIQQDARAKVYLAVKRGVLTRPSVCSECSQEKSLHGHHEDYSRPLEVVWLCCRCHKRRHSGKREHVGVITVNPHDYQPLSAAAKRWGVTYQTAWIYLRQGRIPDWRRFGSTFFIAKSTRKPRRSVATYHPPKKDVTS